MRRAWRVVVVILALFVAAGGTAAAGVYKWTDAEGRVHFGDRPPAGAASETVAIPSVDGPAEGDGPVAPAAHGSVALYSTEWCGVCKRAKAHLRRRGVVFTEYDIEKNSLAHAEFKRLGGRGVPLISVGDKRMRGFNAERLDRMLRDAGWILAE